VNKSPFFLNISILGEAGGMALVPRERGDFGDFDIRNQNMIFSIYLVGTIKI
jgi:hypothetical protein